MALRAIACEQQQGARQPFLCGVKELVYQVLLNLDVSCQQPASSSGTCKASIATCPEAASRLGHQAPLPPARCIEAGQRSDRISESRLVLLADIRVGLCIRS
jgi:hypothetical protein